MKLYYARPSPFVRKVHISAIELKLDDQIEMVETMVAPGKPNETYAANINPLRKIPALELPNGQVLVDSVVICEYLNSLHNSAPLIPASGTDRWTVQTGHAVANGIMDSAVLLRYETFLRPETQRWDVWIDEQWEKIRQGLLWFENRLSSANSSNPVMLDHIALACALGYLDFRNSDYAWRDSFPGLASWHADFATRESYQATKPES